jgi:hypothetical protein
MWESALESGLEKLNKLLVGKKNFKATRRVPVAINVDR